MFVWGGGGSSFVLFLFYWIIFSGADDIFKNHFLYVFIFLFVFFFLLDILLRFDLIFIFSSLFYFTFFIPLDCTHLCTLYKCWYPMYIDIDESAVSFTYKSPVYQRKDNLLCGYCPTSFFTR